MSDLIKEFDPSAATSGSFVVNYLSNGIGKLVIWNDSAWSLDLTFPNGDSNIAPAWCAMIYELTGPAGSVLWAQDKQVNLTTPDLSNVWVVAYRDNEILPGIFPIALTRQTKAGGGSSAVTNPTSIKNDGNATATQYIESTVASESFSASSLSNDGVMTLGNDLHNGSLSFTSTAANITQMQGEVTGDSQEGWTLTSDGVMTLGNGIGRIGKLFLTGNNSALSVQGGANFANSNIAISAGGQLSVGNVADVILNAILECNVASTNVVGSASGSATLFVPIWGSALKIVIITFNAYQSVNPISFALPGSMSWGMFIAGNYGALTITPQLNGVASTIEIITGLAAAGGTSAGQNAIDKNSLGSITGVCNQLLISTVGSNVGRQFVLIGV